MNNRTRQRINLHYKTKLVALTQSLLCQHMESSNISSFRTSRYVDCYTQRQDHAQGERVHATQHWSARLHLTERDSPLSCNVKSLLNKHHCRTERTSVAQGYPYEIGISKHELFDWQLLSLYGHLHAGLKKTFLQQIFPNLSVFLVCFASTKKRNVVMISFFCWKLFSQDFAFSGKCSFAQLYWCFFFFFLKAL